MVKRILVVNGYTYAQAVEGLGIISEETSRFMLTPTEFDLVMFTGGADVGPRLYNDTSPKGICVTSSVRDDREVAIFKRALEAGVKMTGICRGSQFLNVMSGGRMIHHLNNHAGRSHDVETNTGIITVNSYHHQMSVVGPEGHVIAKATSKLSATYIGREDEYEEYTGPEVEAIYYPSTGCAAVQWHPEMMSTESSGYTWYHNMVSDLLHMTKEQFENKYVLKSGLTASV